MDFSNQRHSQTITQTLLIAHAQSGLSLRELARRAGTSHATLRAYEKGTKVPSSVIFLRILEACNFGVDVELSPRIRDMDGVSRGEELRNVLLLAEQFPAKVSKTLGLPCLHKAHL
jgi:transcriptional regulator with XRE-family HTH domain